MDATSKIYVTITTTKRRSINLLTRRFDGALCRRSFIHLGGDRQRESKVKNTRCVGSELSTLGPKSAALTTEPPIYIKKRFWRKWPA